MSSTLYTPRSQEELRKVAESEVGAEIAGAVAPLKSQVGTLQGRQASSLSGLQTMFGSILPHVAGAAENVQTSYDKSFAAQQQIFNAAEQKLNALAQQRSQQAQALAQEIGGPVSVAEFEASVGPSQEALAGYAPNSLLHALGQGQAGVELANAFSGKVFPLVRTEQETNTRRYFEDQIKEIEDQISSIESQKTGKINSRLSELLTGERQYELSKAELSLGKLKADRDWKATLRTLKNEDERLALARQQFGLDEKKTKAEIANLTAQQRLEAQRLGLTAQQYAIENARLNQSEREAAQKTKNNLQTTAMEVIDAALGGGGTVTITVPTEVTKLTAFRNPNSYLKNGKWYVDRKVSQPASGVPPMTDPGKLYNLLLSYGIPKAMALNLVRAKLGVPGFTPGKVDYSASELASMPFRNLRSVAIQLGFTPDPQKPKTRQQLIDYVLDRQRG